MATDPANLPAEIYLDILYDASSGQPNQDPFTWHHNTLVPAGLCLVSHKWRSIITPLLYSRYEFDGHPRRVRSLWRFFRSVVSDPLLAAGVRHLSFASCSAYRKNDDDDDDDRDQIPTYYAEHKSLITQAMLDSGLSRDSELDAQAHRALQAGDFRPLVALILAHVPNLTRLEMQVARSDPFLDAILDYSVSLDEPACVPTRVAFQNLTRLYLAGAKLHDEEEESPDFAAVSNSLECPLYINRHRPLVQLPKLTELFLLGVEIDEDISHWHPSSRISHLAMVYPVSSSLENLRLLLERMPELAYLSLCLPSTDSSNVYRRHQQLWSALRPVRTKLKYLDLNEGLSRNTSGSIRTGMHDDDGLRSSNNDADDSYCCPLRTFRQLRYLAITPLLLYGHKCRHDAKLANHLPLSLESFALYDWNTPILKRFLITNLEDEMGLIALTKPTIPLNSIVVQAEWRPTSYGLPYAKMKYFADQKHVMFNTAARDFTFGAGEDMPFAWKGYQAGRERRRRGYRVRTKHTHVLPRGLEVFGCRGRLDEDWI